MTSVNGQTYTWDANGNLLDDGSKTYTYDQANRLTAIQVGSPHGNAFSWGATYNGDGARLETAIQMGSGPTIPTQYTLDLAAPLVTVLAERTDTATKQYLYGLGDSPPASHDGTNWTYLSGRDGLNSVRQETDASGNVLVTRHFDPYGVPLDGNGGTPFGYTGEAWDTTTQLVFLRARYMQPGLGMFLSRDPWKGYEPWPGTFNGFNYAMGNPINMSDPSGLMPPYPPDQLGSSGLVWFGLCFQLHTGSQFTPFDLGYLDMTAQRAVDICRMSYNSAFWDKDFYHFELGQDLPKTAHELFGWYVHEWRGRYNSDRLFFDALEPLTKELADTTVIHDLRTRYSTEIINLAVDTGKPQEYEYDVSQFINTFVFDNRHSVLEGSVSISFFLGSFYYQIRTVNTVYGKRISFRIDNETDLASGTHVARRYTSQGYYDSVERLIEEDPSLAHRPLYEVIKDENRRVISILKPRTRGETGGSQGGGNLYQTYTWTETVWECLNSQLPWELRIALGDIKVWANFRDMTQDPPGWPAQ